MIDERKLIEYINRKETGEKIEKSLRSTQEKFVDIVEKQPKVGDWIPCSERLPEINGKYICTKEIHSLSSGKIIGKSVELVEFFGGGWMMAKHLKVIAWQPLPYCYEG